MFDRAHTLLPLPGLILFLSLVVLSGCSKTYSTDVQSSQKISDLEGNFNGDLSSNAQFGSAITNLGDLEVDGVIDLAVGTPFDDEGGSDRGAIWILFMDDNGQVDIHQKLAHNLNGFPATLDDGDHLGMAVAGLDDLNNDAVRDLAAGAPGDDDGGLDRGAVWILFLNPDGTVRLVQKISDLAGGFAGTLDDGDQFGSAVANIDDINNDGISDLAVGAPYDDDGGLDRGAVWILFMGSNGIVQGTQKISFTEGGFAGNLENNSRFGSAVSAIGDINGDGVIDIAVGTPGDDDGGMERGAVWILFMSSNGTVINEQKISTIEGSFEGVLHDGDLFGSSLANMGDMNEDGIPELVVGTAGSDDGGVDRGAIWVLFLKATGEVISESKVSDTAGNFDGLFTDNAGFGSAVAGIGDLDGDGVLDIAAGARMDNDGGIAKGALWVLFMSQVKVDIETDSERLGSKDNFIFTEIAR